MSPGTAVEMYVGANSFAHNAPIVRMNSHLQKPRNALDKSGIHHQPWFLE
jgi:hypothetical protein